jgi:hypothetical protein
MSLFKFGKYVELTIVDIKDKGYFREINVYNYI